MGPRAPWDDDEPREPREPTWASEVGDVEPPGLSIRNASASASTAKTPSSPCFLRARTPDVQDRLYRARHDASPRMVTRARIAEVLYVGIGARIIERVPTARVEAMVGLALAQFASGELPRRRSPECYGRALSSSSTLLWPRINVGSSGIRSSARWSRSVMRCSIGWLNSGSWCAARFRSSCSSPI